MTDILGPQYNYMDVFGFLYLIRRLSDDSLCGFRDVVRDRYRQLRKGCLHTDSLIARYRGNIEQLLLCGAAKREELRWSGDSDICYRKLDLKDEAEYMEDWIKKHMSFLDKEVFGLPATGVMPPKSTIGRQGAVFDLFGRPVVKEDLTPGLYIKDGYLFHIK